MTKKNIKCLITAGCSYSQVPNTDVTWPVHLNEYLAPEGIFYLGQGAAGNGIISRKVIYNVAKQLKFYQPSEMLVGIMWSGYDRGTIFSTKELPNSKKIDFGKDVDYYSNPVRIIKDRNYYILNRHWHDELSTNEYKNFNKEQRVMETLEHILRVQWFLKMHKVPYFMVQYDYDVFNDYPYDTTFVKSNPDTKFLWYQIDWEQWLPVENCYQWAKEESGFDFARPPDPHPSTEQHKAFTERVIVPFLLDKKMVYDIVV